MKLKKVSKIKRKPKTETKASSKSRGGSGGLKNLMSTFKTEGYVLKGLDQYLLAMKDKDGDRRWDINSPSSASSCPRGIVYSRLGYESDSNSIDARTRRIFDNGTGVHERLQKYMLDEGMLAMDEVPVFQDELQIQGHTDGLLNLSKYELGVLEIKSINDNGFKSLIDAREEHKEQALVYMFCLEERRLELKGKIETEEELEEYLKSEEYIEFIRDHYRHMKGGAKFTLEEKFQFKLECHRKTDSLLWKASRPINKMVFIYENKNDQAMKEFVVKWDDELLEGLKEKYVYINKFVAEEEVPPRPEEATSKSCQHCRWCRFKSECWIV